MTDILMLDALSPELRQAIAQVDARTLCPKCDGGRGREVSLSIRTSADGVVTMKCYRASCGWFGLTMTDTDAGFAFKRSKPARVYRDPTIPLQGKTKRMLANGYGLDRELMDYHGWRLNERGTTLVMPVRDPFGRTLGHVTRTFATPKKCYTFKATAKPWLDWWVTDDEPTVIVEDCLSACRLAGLGYTAVALLGTGISVAQAKQIRDYATGTAVLALDRDAFVKATKLCKRHAHIVPMIPVCLDEDIKNMKQDYDIHKLFRGYR